MGALGYGALVGTVFHFPWQFAGSLVVRMYILANCKWLACSLERSFR